MTLNRTACRLTVIALIGLCLAPAWAQKKYGPGVTDTEIKIGQTMPYSGPASIYATIGRAEAAYIAKINAEGGIYGRKINLISLDDGYSPPRTVEQTRKLVEQEEVLMIFASLGTATNTAIEKYMNAKKVPHILLATAALKWDDPTNYPWSMALVPNQRADVPAYVRYLSKVKPDAKAALLYQNDDFGRDYVRMLRKELGERANKLIVAETSYEVTDPTVDSQLIALKDSGADVLFSFATPKFASMTIRKIYDLGWRPLHFVPSNATSVEVVLKPAGLDKAAGLISTNFVKDPSDPDWKNDPATKSYLAFMRRFYPEADPLDTQNVVGYITAEALEQVLKQCGDDLTRENVMRQAANFKDVELPMLLPGIKLNTSPTDYTPIKQMQLRRFDGKTWVRIPE
ncbi:MAG TPA: ABC transporter substrate-binding protein [Burkholderiales bacterium]|nr:ABC transporter substrate-binding protein [Burkholderiales bacterium]